MSEQEMIRQLDSHVADLATFLNIFEQQRSPEKYEQLKLLLRDACSRQPDAVARAFTRSLRQHGIEL